MAITRRSRLDDQAIMANSETGERARDINSARLRKWVMCQTPDDRRRFCSHGCYVGLEGALSYTCPRCVEEGYQPID